MPNMSNGDLAAQLSYLEQILGKTVSLLDPSELAAETPEAPEMGSDDRSSSWETWQTKEDASARTSSPWNQEPPAERSLRPPPSLHQENSSANANFDCSSLRAGDTASKDIDFCSWKMILAYPTTFIGKSNKPRARPFFDSILVGNAWDFFYLHDPNTTQRQPHLLVPTVQFEEFLKQVNQALGIALTIPPGVNRDKFHLKFGKGGTPRPRYLLRSHNQESLKLESWPEILDSDIRGFEKAFKVHKDIFARTLVAMTASKNQRDKKMQAQERERQRATDRRLMMELTQDHLGLRKGSISNGVVFICMDLEAIEVAPHPVSEVGIAILDTHDISGVPPGPSGSGWWQFIKAYHLRVKEYAGLVNYRFVRGCPDAFDFGTSSFHAKAELADAIRSILESYIDGRRDLLFIAHDTKQDRRYLSTIGVDIFNMPGMVGEIDTRVLHQAWRNSNDAGSLQTVLSDLCIANKNLHNAGNDATYTLRGMIGLAVEKPRKDKPTTGEEEYVPALWESGNSIGVGVEAI